VNYLIFQKYSIFQTIEYISLLASSFVIVFILFWKKQDALILLICSIYSLILLSLPLGEISTLVISMHIGIVGLIFCVLYFYGFTQKEKLLEKIFAFSITVLFIVVKGIGLLSFGIIKSNYYIAYCTGFILFTTSCFLINQFIKYSAKEKIYLSFIVNSVCAFGAYFILYALSFKIPGQSAIFEADTVVLLLIFLFIFISLSLYTFLFIKSKEKLPLILSAIIFFISSIVMFIANEKIRWEVYSLIFNALLFILTATFIYYSTKINSKILLNFAITGFVLQILTRYIDTIWDLLSGSVLFIVSGVLGIIVGLLIEKNRRNLIKKMNLSREQNK